LIEKFRDFQIKFIDTLVSQKTAFCVSCKHEYYHMICPYDYLKEVYSWLEEYLDENSLREFLRIFSMGFRKIEWSVERRFFYRNNGPSQHGRERVDIGICETCENFSDNLKRDTSNHWVCENCRAL
jgi:hypothetical protein